MSHRRSSICCAAPTVASTPASPGGPLEERVSEHNSGALRGYTLRRRPVELVWCEAFRLASDAVAAERRIKGWSRRKKRALIDGDWLRLKRAAKKDFKRKG